MQSNTEYAYKIAPHVAEVNKYTYIMYKISECVPVETVTVI